MTTENNNPTKDTNGGKVTPTFVHRPDRPTPPIKK